MAKKAQFEVVARSNEDEPRWPRQLSFVIEVMLLIAAMAWLHGTPAPEVNEPHYLAKAKHFWNPEWCRGDMFLDSPDVHYFFEYAFGWLTLYFPLPAVAWIGRGIAWSALAGSWCYFARAYSARFGMALASGVLVLLGVKHFHLAGEWLVGGVEAKCFSFPLVFWGLGLFLRGAWRSSCLAFGAATAMHVLTGGWVYLAVFLTAWWTKSTRGIGHFFQGAFLAALVGSVGIVPALLGTGGDAKQAAAAHMIYVYERLPHHLLLGSMATERKERFAVLLGGWLVISAVGMLVATRRNFSTPGPELARVTRLNVVVGITLLFALVGVGLDLASRHYRVEAAQLLRFYWFRASDVMVPVGFAISLLYFIAHAFRRTMVTQFATAVLLAISGYFVVMDGIAERRLRVPRADASVIPHDRSERNSRTATHHNWVRACEWINSNTPRDAIVWTARRQQSFKWYAERAEVHNYKDIPQDPTGLLEWRDRLEVVRGIARRGGIWRLSKADISALAKKYDFDYLMIYKSGLQTPLPFELVYPLAPDENLHYEIYAIPQIDQASK